VRCPLVFAALSLAGYHYSALVLSGFCLQTGVQIAAAGLAYHAMMRWLYRAETRMQLAAASTGEAELPDTALVMERFDSQARMIIRNVSG
jgi:small-conductance mechanosensitive channel